MPFWQTVHYVTIHLRSLDVDFSTTMKLERKATIESVEVRSAIANVLIINMCRAWNITMINKK
jgi:hypothetical protein